MRLHHILVLATAMVSTTTPLRAWSAEGHQTVGMIAQQILEQSGKFAAIQPLLGSLTLADISTCPDQVRELEDDPSYKLSPACQSVFPDPPKGTSSWHFINIPVTPSGLNHRSVLDACPQQCILTQIETFGQVLADANQPASARLQALSFVVHFIGDVHQPLHDAIRAGDAGGNAEEIMLNGTKSSLHYAWDSPLVSAINSDAQGLATDLAPEIEAAEAEPRSQPLGWALQAWDLANSTAYSGIPPQNGDSVVATLSTAYQQAAHLAIRQQLARAGVRLAAFIEAATGESQKLRG